MEYPEYAPLRALLEQKLKEQGRVLLAIDGRCGSGKSTHAAQLAEWYGGAVIPMDDFFLPKELRTPARFAQPGGNVHYERFLQEVGEPAAGGGAVVYRPFDCGAMDYAPARTVPHVPLIICEGTYSLHPTLRHLYDVAVFSTCAPEVQRQRLLEREGADKLRRFEAEWIPLEEAYFAACQVEQCCDLTLTSG